MSANKAWNGVGWEYVVAPLPTLDQVPPPATAVSLAAQRIVALADPVAPQDADTKAARDAAIVASKIISTRIATTSTAITTADVLVVSNGANLTQTLPSAVAAGPGRKYTVKNSNASPATLASAAGTIDGAATLTLGQYDSADVVSDGTNWLVV